MQEIFFKAIKHYQYFILFNGNVVFYENLGWKSKYGGQFNDVQCANIKYATRNTYGPTTKNGSHRFAARCAK